MPALQVSPAQHWSSKEHSTYWERQSWQVCWACQSQM
jgi:hypothetical protein